MIVDRSARTARSLLAALLCLVGCGNVVAAGEPFFKGVTVSSPTMGREWGWPEMASTLDELKGLGVNWVAIHPYARIRADGGLDFPQDAAQPYVTRPLDWAHERGLGVMLVPHIAYWGTPFLWRGEIGFDTDRQWDRFFSDYEKWIVGLARVAEAHHAGLFCIGLEYSRAMKFESRWRGVIASIRAVYHGRLTYGANWDTFEDVPFWDALDYIGVLAYFPLSGDPEPTVADLSDGWARWMQRLDAISRKYGKRVVFTEIGYPASLRAAAQPWAFHEDSGGDARRIQMRCFEAALALPRRYDFLAGMFWWKWFPRVPGTDHENFDVRAPEVARILAHRWAD